MAKSNFYGVRGEKDQAIYTDWQTCQKEKADSARFGKVSFKGFATRNEAENFLKGNDPDGIYQDELKDSNLYYAYTDGSYNPTTEKIGWGVAIVKNRQVVAELSGNSNPDYKEHGQVAGEIDAALAALRYALNHDLPSLTIAYDYRGIEQWYRKTNFQGQWQANHEMSETYQTEVQNLASLFASKVTTKAPLNFIKVSAHSQVRFNEVADELAAEATLISEK